MKTLIAVLLFEIQLYINLLAKYSGSRLLSILVVSRVVRV